MDIQRVKKRQQDAKHRAKRRSLAGTAERPRLSVYRSARHIYAQVIDDDRGVTLASASTRDKTLRDQMTALGKTEAAKRIGAAVAQAALSAGVTQVCYDRRHYKYHGRVKALADAAREGGLSF